MRNERERLYLKSFQNVGGFVGRKNREDLFMLRTKCPTARCPWEGYHTDPSTIGSETSSAIPLKECHPIPNTTSRQAPPAVSLQNRTNSHIHLLWKGCAHAPSHQVELQAPGKDVLKPPPLLNQQPALLDRP